MNLKKFQSNVLLLCFVFRILNCELYHSSNYTMQFANYYFILIAAAYKKCQLKPNRLELVELSSWVKLCCIKVDFSR